jgi:hypothetical protein
MIIDTNGEKNGLEPLPPALLAEMFKSGIVVIPEEFEQQGVAVQKAAPPELISSPVPLPAFPHDKQPAVSPLVFLGNFSRKVLVVVHDNTALHLNDADFALLAKILAAVKLTVADIAVVNAARYTLQYELLNAQLTATVALYFGVEPVTIGVPFKVPMFQVQPWNHTTFLYAPSLKDMNIDTAEALEFKKQLWGALRKIFE